MKPPRVAAFFLSRCAGRDDSRFVLADLQEEFDARIARQGARAARRWYWMQARRSAGPFLRSRLTRRSSLAPSARRAGLVGQVWEDLRYGGRSLRQHRGFTAVIALTLALGIGANASTFSVVYALFLRPLPYAQPDRLMEVGWKTSLPRVPHGFYAYWSAPRLRLLAQEQRVFSGVAGFARRGATLTGVDQPERVALELVTGNYFSVLGVRTSLGRAFNEADDVPGAERVALLSHDLWVRRFGADAGVIGRTLDLNGVPFAIAGVLPTEFRGQSGQIDVWLPTSAAAILFNRILIDSPVLSWLEVVGRLAPGVSGARAAAGLSAVGRDIALTTGGDRHLFQEVQLVPLDAYKRDPAVARSFVILFAAVGLVLLVACVNIAEFLITRAVARRREIALRLALGATPGRIVRQLLVEHTILAAVGGAGAAVVAIWGTKLLAASSRAIAGRQVGITASQMFDFYTIQLDGAVLAFNFALALATAFLFGLLPAWVAATPDLNGSLSDSAGGRTGTSPRYRLRRGLVVSEIALALVLVTSAGLMTRSLIDLHAIRLGYDATDVITFNVTFSKRPGADREMLRRLAALPGVEAAGGMTDPPFGGFVNETPVAVQPSSGSGADTSRLVGVHYVGGAAFSAIHTPILRGRAFTDADDAHAPRVAIVNATAARALWSNRDPVGQRIHLDVNWPDGQWAEVVGIVGDIRYGQAEDVVEPDVYLPYTQGGFLGWLFVRTPTSLQAQLPAIRHSIRAVDPNIALSNIQPLAAVAADAISRTTYASTLLGCFAAIAMFLAAVGTYGIVSHLVSERRKEIGIRLALGAEAGRIVRLMLREGFPLIGCGVFGGIVAAVGTTNLLKSSLYGVSSTDPATFVVAALVLILVAVAAAYIPARRATRTDPLVVLRSE
jgi:predicted permease